MKVEIAKDDLLKIRDAMVQQFRELEGTAAAQSSDPKWQRCVEPQMKAIRKFIGHLERAIKKAHGHDCNRGWYEPLILPSERNEVES